jgi:hypothetical protein
MRKLLSLFAVLIFWPSLSGAQGIEEACPPSTRVIGNLQTRNTTTHGLRQQACVDLWGRIFIPGVPVGLINVQSYGARGDGTTDSTGPFANAIATALITGFGIYVPTETNGAYLVSSGFLLPRKFQVVCSPPGAEIKLTVAAGTLFTFGTVTDPGWQMGGVTNCRLSGNGGGADTSRGVQIGSGTQQAQGVHLTNLEIASFGHGVVASGNGSGFAAVLDRVKIHNNACNGILFETTTAPETWTITNSMIFNNGNGSATCTGVQVAANAGGSARFIGVHFDNNGNGTLGQIHNPATATGEWSIVDSHFEKALQVDSRDIVCLAAGGINCTIKIVNSSFIQNPGAATNQPTIVIAAGVLELNNSGFQLTAGNALTPLVDLGAGVSGNAIWFTARNNVITCGGTVTNCQVVTVTGTAATINYDITGTALSNFGAATNLQNIVAGTIGCHDLGVLANNGGPTGSRICTGKLSGGLFGTLANCTSSASPAVCAAAAAGSVTVAAAATTKVVNTTAVTANSQIILAADSGLGTKLGVTCNTQSSLVLGTPVVSARTAGTSFTITLAVAPTTNPLCISYQIIN